MRCDGGATRSPPHLAPVPAHPVPFACNEGDREHRNAGSEARRCCRAGEEEGQCVSAAGSTLRRAGCKLSAGSCAAEAGMSAVLLVDAIKGSSRRALFVLPWLFIAQSWALPTQSSLGKWRHGLAWSSLPAWRRSPSVKAGAGRATLGMSERMSCVRSRISCNGQQQERRGRRGTSQPTAPAWVVLVFMGHSCSPDPTGAPGRGQSPRWWCQARMFRESSAFPGVPPPSPHHPRENPLGFCFLSETSDFSARGQVGRVWPGRYSSLGQLWGVERAGSCNGVGREWEQ